MITSRAMDLVSARFRRLTLALQYCPARPTYRAELTNEGNR
jgi:hypothetical protein